MIRLIAEALLEQGLLGVALLLGVVVQHFEALGRVSVASECEGREVPVETQAGLGFGVFSHLQVGLQL